jgi:hypothetical protein
MSVQWSQGEPSNGAFPCTLSIHSHSLRPWRPWRSLRAESLSAPVLGTLTFAPLSNCRPSRHHARSAFDHQVIALKLPRLVLLLLLLPAFANAGTTVSPLVQVFGEQRHDPAISTIDAQLGFPLGQKAATPEEIDAALRTWAKQSERLRLVAYGQTHQGRPLSMAIVSSAANIARLDTIQAELDELADPRRTNEARAREIINRAPAVAFLAYSIHGNETSGSDAALALVYHLIASDDAQLMRLLEDTVVIIDPLMNPDGRARAVSDLRGFANNGPVFDDQHLGRFASWPFGRGNHYVFDMNRDWIYATQPETRGRIAFLRQWHPLLFVDAHEMGAQDTFLFSPPRAPINPHYSPRFRDFLQRFSDEQASAFDQRGWVYYSGEWNEGWYPGYSDAWGGLRGAVNILYEQARVADHGVRQANQRVLTYQEAVAHQLGSSWDNLGSLNRHHRGLLAAFWEDRRAVVAADGSYGRRLFVIPGDQHPTRLAALLDLLELQNIEVYRATQELRFGGASDMLGRRVEASVPAGSLLVPNRQPLARVIANLFEFDPRIDEASLAREREELLRSGSGTIYDVTSWNLGMLYGLEAFAVQAGLPQGVERVRGASIAQQPAAAPSPVGWLIPGHDDGALRAAVELMKRGLRPRVALKEVEFDGRRHPRGSLVLTRRDHRDMGEGALIAALGEASVHLRETIVPLGSGRGPGDLPDLGGGEFGLLDPPRVAILAQGNPNLFGFQWHYLDQTLGLAPTILAENRLGQTDLRRYNVIVLPDRWGNLPDDLAGALKTWIEGGGTLVASGSAAAQLAVKDGMLQSRTLPAALEDLAPYRDRLAREWLAGQAAGQVSERLWSHAAIAGEPSAWPSTLDEKKEDASALRARDDWRRLFMPRGAFLAARCDSRHWLTLGCDGMLPVLFGNNQPLMAAASVDAPVRLGVYAAASGRDSDGWRAYGWAALPPGQNLLLRMGGLLWPEAQERLANTAWVTRERVGRGQVILFATTPEFRGTAAGMRRVMGNAVVYGPGLGAAPVILP